MIPDDNTPSWIRDLYQDIYPNITTPSQGRRIPWGGATGPMVGSMRQRAKTPVLQPPNQNVNTNNPWAPTVTREPPMPDIGPVRSSANERFPLGFNQNRNDLPPNIPGMGNYEDRTNRFGDATPPLSNTSPNLPSPSTLNRAVDPLQSIPSPFDLLFGGMRQIGENTPFLANMRQRNLDRRAQRRPFTFPHQDRHVEPNMDVLNPLSIQDLLDALRGGREQNDPRGN